MKGNTMLKNDLLDQWDRENFFHPSTHLAQFARGEMQRGPRDLAVVTGQHDDAILH